MVQRLMMLVAVCAAVVAWTPAFGQDGGAAGGVDEALQAAEDHASDQAGDHSGDHGDGYGDDGHGKKGKASPLASVNEGIATGITALIVFLITAGILGRVVWPKISGALDERQQKILDEIDAAEAARQQAKDALDEYERSLAEARTEAQAMLEQTKAEQQKMAAELKAKSEVELQALKEKAQRDIESARRAAVAEIYAEAADLATAVASKILAREVNAGDKQRLVDEAVAELGSARGSASNN